MLWIGVDVGGTFTDGVVYDDETHQLRYAKAPSTPQAPTSAVLEVLTLLHCDLRNARRFCHGLTIGTNALIENKGAEVWMLTTEGFRDLLEMGRGARPVLYDLRTQKTPPLVPRTRTVEIGERLRFDGSILRELDLEQAAQAVSIVPNGPDIAVAICLINSYANKLHEQKVKELCLSQAPQRYVSASSEVLPQFREFNRFNTTVLNAYVGPLMERYVNALSAELSGRGYREQIFLTTSNGGVSTVGRAKELPVTTLLSGPASGVGAAIHLGRLRDVPNLITCDMGGTSTDVCLIEGLRVPLTERQKIGEYESFMPQIAINAVGAGGGSVAWLDAGDILKVGPHSMGADPGPACYGKGGREATVTDANLVLGRLAPDTLAGGQIVLDRNLARVAVQRLGAQVAFDGPAMAEGIVRIAVARMVSAIKEISISKGYDPRDFTLLPYGGAGPMHAAAIADELEMSRVLVPIGPGNFAALGSLISDLRRDYVRTRTVNLSDADFASIEALYREIEDEARRDLIAEGVNRRRIQLQRAAGMRYLGQSWELYVELPDGLKSVDGLNAAFAEAHDRRFGHRSTGEVEIVSFRVVAMGLVDKPDFPLAEARFSIGEAQRSSRDIWFEGAYLRTPIYDRSRLPPGAACSGPAIVEEIGATTVVPPGWRFSVLAHGELLLERVQV